MFLRYLLIHIIIVYLVFHFLVAVGMNSLLLTHSSIFPFFFFFQYVSCAPQQTHSEAMLPFSFPLGDFRYTHSRHSLSDDLSPKHSFVKFYFSRNFTSLPKVVLYSVWRLLRNLMSFEVRKKMILDLTKAPGTRRVSQRLAKGWGSGGHTTTPSVPADCLPFLQTHHFFFFICRARYVR